MDECPRAHYYYYVDCKALLEVFYFATSGDVANSVLTCGVAWYLVAPMAGLLPRGRITEVAEANEPTFCEVPTVKGSLHYVTGNPLLTKICALARWMLQALWCVIIKIHHQEHA